MTALLFLLSVLLGSVLVCYVLSRTDRAQTVEEWRGILSYQSARALSSLELQTDVDKAMTTNAMRRAVKERDSGRLSECLRMVDIAARLLDVALDDRLDRLRGLTLCLRMKSAVAPLPPVSPDSLRVPQNIGLARAAYAAHHFIVSAKERLFVRIVLLRAAYKGCLRVFLRGSRDIAESPRSLKPWTLCDDATADWFGVLDPAHLEAYRAILASEDAKS